MTTTRLPSTGLAKAETFELGSEIDSPPKAPAWREETAVRLTQAFTVALFVFPSDTVIKAVGANGYAASLIGLAALGLWVCALAFGLHNPLSRRNPIRMGFALLWVSSLVSYALMSAYVQLPRVQLAGDRWLIQLGMMTGVAYIATDGIRTKDGLRRVVRAAVLAASFCAFVAVLQFSVHLDLSSYLRMLPGFELNGDAPMSETRFGLTRVAGTSVHPIELGVVSAMMLPLALWLARFGEGQAPWRRWGPTALIACAAVISVSRSAVVGLVIALVVVFALIPVKDRAIGFLLLPIGLAAVFMVVPGYFRTMLDFFVAGSNGSDDSVIARTDDYALVAREVSHSLWLGQGPGHYIPRFSLEILDNQYLSTLIDLGVFGLASLLIFLLLPATVALSVRRRTTDPQVQWLCAALAASALASVACTFTFDSFSFPMFLGTQCWIAGIAGMCWSQNPISRTASAS